MSVCEDVLTAHSESERPGHSGTLDLQIFLEGLIFEGACTFLKENSRRTTQIKQFFFNKMRVTTLILAQETFLVL